jgi:uncharacterized RDD family membrane protein YckC
MNAQTQQNPYAPPKAEVEDFVDERITTEPAGRGIRLGGWVVDAVISFLLLLPLLIAVGFNVLQLLDPNLLFGLGGLITLVASIAWVGVTIVLVKRNGQTIGKKLVGIKVVRSDGSRASLGRIFWLRNVVNILPGFIPIAGYFYFFVDHGFIFGDKRQCVHDKIADTIVVRA